MPGTAEVTGLRKIVRGQVVPFTATVPAAIPLNVQPLQYSSQSLKPITLLSCLLNFHSFPPRALPHLKGFMEEDGGC